MGSRTHRAMSKGSLVRPFILEMGRFQGLLHAGETLYLGSPFVVLLRFFWAFLLVHRQVSKILDFGPF